MKRLWDKPRILEVLKKLSREGKDLSYNHLARTMQSLVSAAAYHFGSYRYAIEEAGLDYDDVSRRPRWTREEIVRLIKQTRRKGEDLHWLAVIQRRDELGRAAFASLQPRLFGGWKHALKAAGLNPDDIARYRRWSQDSIIAALKKRSKARKQMNSGSLQADDPGLHAAAVRHFGTYDLALVAAGLDPGRLRQRRRWTREEVAKELRVFQKQQGGITDSALRRKAPALYGAVLRHFRSVAGALKQP